MFGESSPNFATNGDFKNGLARNGPQQMRISQLQRLEMTDTYAYKGDLEINRWVEKKSQQNKLAKTDQFAA